MRKAERCGATREVYVRGARGKLGKFAGDQIASNAMTHFIPMTESNRSVVKAMQISVMAVRV